MTYKDSKILVLLDRLYISHFDFICYVAIIISWGTSILFCVCVLACMFVSEREREREREDTEREKREIN